MLGRAGGLEVTVHGDVLPRMKIVLSHPPPGYRLTDRRIPKDRVLSMDDLPVGPLLCKLVIANPSGGALVLDETSITIEAGSRTQVDLVADASNIPAPVSAQGRFHLPPEWGFSHGFASVRRVGPSTGSPHERAVIDLSKENEVEGLPGTFNFDIPRLAPGPYQATLRECPYPIAFTVPAAGSQDLELRMPPPVTVHVTPRDAITGEVLLGDCLVAWVGVGFQSGGLGATTRAAGQHAFRARVPAGQIVFSAHNGLLYRDAESTVQASAGLATDLLVHFRASLQVGLACEGEELAWPSDFPHKIERVDGRDVKFTWGIGPGCRAFLTDEGGHYRLPLPKLPGFKPVEDLDVDMQVGEEQILTVEYERTKPPR